MSNTDTIDIIMPTFNGLPYIKEAIASVMAQTHTHWLLYVIDDGSTDKTGDYVQGLGDDRITYKKVKNSGPSAARNLGIKLSNSPYVAFLDADDIWYPAKLEQQLNLLQSNPDLGLVYGHQQMIRESGEVTDSLYAKLHGHVFYKLLSGNRITGSASMVLTTREVLQHTGDFLVNFVIGEDWELWLRIAKDYQVAYVDDLLVGVRDVESGSQHKYARNAKQLLELGDYIVKSYGLQGRSRRRLMSHIYLHASLAYFSAQQRTESRKFLKKALKLNPFVLTGYNYKTWCTASRIYNYQSLVWRIRNSKRSKGAM